jgi:hypothetical protein
MLQVKDDDPWDPPMAIRGWKNPSGILDFRHHLKAYEQCDLNPTKKHI